MVRHPNYLGDLIMALAWSLPCGELFEKGPQLCVGGAKVEDAQSGCRMENRAAPQWRE